MHEKLEKKTEESINKILEEGITTNNLDHLYKLTKINCMAKKGEDSMNYGYGNYRGNYGRDEYGRDAYGREQYGDYDGYGARRRDSRGRYMGHDHLDRMYDDYSRYEEGRRKYGANEDTKKSLEYMLRSMEDFARMLKEEAQSPEEVQMIKQTAQRIAQM